MRSGIISLIFVAGLGLAFFSGQRAESQDSKTKTEAQAYCPHCAKKGGAHPGHASCHHRTYEYSCLVGSKDKNAGRKASENTALFNTLGEQGWKLATHDGAQFCFMRHKR